MSQINGRSSSRPPARQCVAKCLLKIWQADDSPCPDKLVVSPLGPYLPPYIALCPACIRTGVHSSLPRSSSPPTQLPECVLAPLILSSFTRQGLWSTAVYCADSIFLVYCDVKFGTYSLQDKAHAPRFLATTSQMH